jgi:predicted small lipoprotein YifL
MKHLIIALAAFTFLFLTSGCGQSGPLYIPDNPSKISLPAPESEEDEEENGNIEKE